MKRSDIEEGLRMIGLRQRDAVEVHSSLSSLGWVEGGAATVVDALMAVVGVTGALVMSAYPVSPALPLTEEEKARGIVWKVRIFKENYDGPTGLGAIADDLCKRPGTVLGTGLHRVCAWGQDAELHSKGYRHLIDVDGWVLLMGVGIDRCSSLHLAEETVGIPAQIQECWRVPDGVRRDYPAEDWGIGYGSTPEDAWIKVWEEAKRRGLVRTQFIGHAECTLFKARSVLGIYEEFLRRDPFGLFGISHSSKPR